MVSGRRLGIAATSRSTSEESRLREGSLHERSVVSPLSWIVTPLYASAMPLPPEASGIASARVESKGMGGGIHEARRIV